MDSSSIILTMIFACAAMIVLMIMSKPIRFIVKIIINSIIGAAAIAAANAAIGPILGFYIGINAFTVLVTGILGVPGFFALLAVRMLV